MDMSINQIIARTRENNPPRSADVAVKDGLILGGAGVAMGAALTVVGLVGGTLLAVQGHGNLGSNLRRASNAGFYATLGAALIGGIAGFAGVVHTGIDP